jgi:hypothetical protein
MVAKIEGKVFEFHVRPQGPLKPGDLCLISFDGQLVFGHYYSDDKGSEWLIQSDRIIEISSKKNRD